MLRIKNLYNGEGGSANADNVNVLDSMRELLDQFGDPGVWENLAETINEAKKYTNTDGEEFASYKPREIFGAGLNLEGDLDALKIEVMNVLNDMNEWYNEAQKINESRHGDFGGGSYGGDYGGYTDSGNTDTPSTIDGVPVVDAPIPVVTGDEDSDTPKDVNIDRGITTPPEGETFVPDTSRQQGTLYVDNNGMIDVFDSNGKKIDTYGKGKYSIYEYKYDENGNPIAARISPDGEEEKWVNMKDANDNVYFVKEGQKGNYSLEDNNYPVYDANKKQVGTVNEGDYIVYEVQYDNNGNAIAVRISPDGEEEKWIYLDPGKTNGYYYEVGQKGNYFLKEGSLSIYDDNGNIIGTANAGSYNVYGSKVDENGNMIAIKISKPGEDERWIYLNSNETNGFFMGIGQKGTYTSDGQALKIFDNKGNVIGTLTDGVHNVYKVRYDSEGNIIAVRISPNGADEQWIYTTDENGKSVGTFNSLEKLLEVDQGKVVVTTKRSNKSLKYLGILGGLSVAFGATLLVKKKLNQQNETTNEYEYEDYGEEEPIEPGEYNVYEFKKDENNNITDARISEDNAKEDLWVHF